MQYLREFDQGIRGLFSPGFRITGIEARRDATLTGGRLFDGAWMLSEISDMTVPADTDARADAYRLADDRVWNIMRLKSLDDDGDGLVSLRGLGHGAIGIDVVERLAGKRNVDINIKDPLIKALRARRQS